MSVNAMTIANVFTRRISGEIPFLDIGPAFLNNYSPSHVWAVHELFLTYTYQEPFVEPFHAVTRDAIERDAYLNSHVHAAAA